MKLKYLFILFFPAIIFIIILLVSSIFTQEKPSNPASDKQTNKNAALVVTDVQPSQDNQITKPLLPVQQVAFKFNMPLQANGFIYTVSPQVQTTLQIDTANNLYIISPKTAWQPGKTIITITTKTKSQNGKTLKSPFQYVLNTAFPYDENTTPFTEKNSIQLR